MPRRNISPDSGKISSSILSHSKFADPIKRIAAEIKKSRDIIIAGHERPDGDTAGASLALFCAINKIYKGTKKVEVRSKEPLPPYLEFLPFADRIKTGVTASDKKFDLAVILECSDLGRAGDIIQKDQIDKIVNIDHHAVSGAFGDINYIDPSSSAVACQIFYIIKYLGCPIDKNIAECIYTGILTDTGKLQQKNTTPEAFRIAAECLEKGRIDIAAINESVYTNKTPSALRLLGAALSSLEIVKGNRGDIAFITLTAENFAETGASESDTEEIINYPLSIKGVEGVVFLRRVNSSPDGKIKISMRSKGALDVLSVAASYGGGGHRHAAGFSVPATKTINEMKREIVRQFNRTT